MITTSLKNVAKNDLYKSHFSRNRVSSLTDSLIFVRDCSAVRSQSAKWNEISPRMRRRVHVYSPSLLMPILRHFFSRQYWHWFLWCWSMGQFLFPRQEYVRFLLTLLLKKLLQPATRTPRLRWVPVNLRVCWRGDVNWIPASSRQNPNENVVLWSHF
jgi:hypothetical protein